METKRTSLNSKTTWSNMGFRLKNDATPSDYWENRYCMYPVYDESQVEPKRKHYEVPAKTIGLLAALWTVNRYAKRCRDAAQSCYRSRAFGFAGHNKRRKEQMYNFKSQAMHYAIEAKLLSRDGYHRFSNGNYAEVWTGDGYSFHRPCPMPQGDIVCTDMEDICACVKFKEEPKLKDSIKTLQEFLCDKPRVQVYEWTKRYYPRYEDDEEEDLG